VQQARAFRAGRLAPDTVERGARRSDRTVDVGLAGHPRTRKQVAGRGLAEVANLAGGGLGGRAVDEEAVLLLDRDSHC